MPKLRHRAAHYILKKLGMFNRRYSEYMYNRNFIIPIINGRKTYKSEHWMFTLIELIFRFRRGGFVDVGVNLGQTLLKVAAVDSNRKYVGFEPNPACADYASALAAANGLPYTIVPAGLAESSTVLELHIYRTEDTDPSASMIADYREGSIARKHICVWRADDLPPSLLPEATAIIKIDVEGGEASVLSGLHGYIAKTRPFILVEIFPVGVDDQTFRLKNQETLESTLAELDYVKFAVEYDEAGYFTGIKKIDKLGLKADLSLIDYVMSPSEEADRLLQAVSQTAAV